MIKLEIILDFGCKVDNSKVYNYSPIGANGANGAINCGFGAATAKANKQVKTN